MRHHHQHSPDVTTGTPAARALEPVYAAHRACVDHAYQRLQTILAGRHGPVQERQAAVELTAALREATTTAAQLLWQTQTPAAPPHGRWRHRHVRRVASPAVARWSSELVRLSQIGVWLRRTTLDDLGVHVPSTIRVGNYAANGPHIAGLGFSAGDFAEVHEPRIGVDLPAIVDGADRQTATTLPPTVASVPARAA